MRCLRCQSEAGTEYCPHCGTFVGPPPKLRQPTERRRKLAWVWWMIAISVVIGSWVTTFKGDRPDPVPRNDIKVGEYRAPHQARSPKPAAWRLIQEISLSSGLIRTGDSEESVRRKAPEPLEWEVPLDPQVRIELATETVRSIKKIDTFYMEGKWFRVYMWRKVPRRPYLIRWKGHEQPAEFVVYRVEVPREGALSVTAPQAAEPAGEKPADYSAASPLTRQIRDSGASVDSIVVGGGRIRVGDLADDSVAYAKASDRIAPPFVQGDPALPGSLIVVQTYSIDGRRFCLESKRQADPGPYKVSRIIVAPR